MLQEAGGLTKDVSVLRRLTFAAASLHKDVPRYSELVSRFGFKKSVCPVSEEKLTVFIENVEYLDSGSFMKDTDLFTELIHMEGFQGKPLGIVLISPNNTCKLCKGTLLIRADRPSFPTVYTEEFGTIDGTHFRKHCQNHGVGCSFTQHYGFSTSVESQIEYDSDSLELPFFLSSNMTAFHTSMLHHLTAEMLISQVSYQQKADTYNYIHGYDSAMKKSKSAPSLVDDSSSMATTDRKILDRRRLEEAHLKLSIIDVYKRYKEHFPVWIICTSLQATLENITPTFYEVFSTKYAAHQCTFPGCKNVLVVDGNMKNRRDVCAASEAGYIQYEGLPTFIKTGCQYSPGYSSKYCFEHASRIAVSEEGSATNDGYEGVVKIITAKKETRSGVYYQVAWIGCQDKLTWISSSALPQDMIYEYEQGIIHQENIEINRSYGVTKHTITTNTIKSGPPPSKKARIPTVTFLAESVDSMDVKCNTEKDKKRTNQRTAGLLAGLRPCGIIVLLAELFTSESKAQVYGCLHEFLQKNPVALNNIGEIFTIKKFTTLK